MLQRVLLAYARWNNKVGYCQGFNVIAAVILDVMERQEDCALKVKTPVVKVDKKLSYRRDNARRLGDRFAVQGRSRSFKVTDGSTVCDFLLVNNTNLHPVSHRFPVTVQ